MTFSSPYGESSLTLASGPPGLFYDFKQFLFKYGHYLEEVSYYREIGLAHDGGVGVGVDGYDELGGAHAGEMLGGAGDAAGYVKHGGDDLAGLAHLVGVLYPAFVHGHAGSAHGAAKGFGQVLYDLEAGGAAGAAAA